MSTMREHLEAIRDRNDRPTPAHKWNEEDYRDAVAALAILDAAETDIFDDRRIMVALIPDPDVWELQNGVGPWVRKS